MSYTFHELKGKSVAELRTIAAGVQHDAVQGFTQMNKEHLLAALCQALSIDVHEHHEVVGIDKAALKVSMRALKAGRDEALAAHDRVRLKEVRRQMHHLKRKIHRATV
jgi:hypothetical protein